MSTARYDGEWLTSIVQRATKAEAERDAAEAKLAAIDARHIPIWSPRLGHHVCFTCAEPFGKWPCPDHLTLHPRGGNR